MERIATEEGGDDQREGVKKMGALRLKKERIARGQLRKANMIKKGDLVSLLNVAQLLPGAIAEEGEGRSWVGRGGRDEAVKGRRVRLGVVGLEGE